MKLPITGPVELRFTSWDAIEGVVFDVDGTLYDHRRLRMRMTGLLFGHCLQSRTGWRDVRVVQAFRRCREELAEAEASQLERTQFALPAKRLAVSEDIVREIIQEWMDERPLPFLKGYSRPGIHALFDALQRSGRKIGILSDYPVERKLAAMSLRADVLASAVDEHIDRLKPHPAGLLHVIERLGCRPDACLMIGDRSNRDGEAARRAGTRYLHVGRPLASDASCRDFLDPVFLPVIGRLDPTPAHLVEPNPSTSPKPEGW